MFRRTPRSKRTEPLHPYSTLFRYAGGKWIRLVTGDRTDLSLLPEATPTKAKAGINDLVLVRLGSTVRALHAVCAHAGGPLQDEIGRAHVCTPVTNAHLVCRLLL